MDVVDLVVQVRISEPAFEAAARNTGFRQFHVLIELVACRRIGDRCLFRQIVVEFVRNCPERQRRNCQRPADPRQLALLRFFRTRHSCLDRFRLDCFLDSRRSCGQRQDTRQGPVLGLFQEVTQLEAQRFGIGEGLLAVEVILEPVKQSLLRILVVRPVNCLLQQAGTLVRIAQDSIEVIQGKTAGLGVVQCLDRVAQRQLAGFRLLRRILEPVKQLPETIGDFIRGTLGQQFLAVPGKQVLQLVPEPAAQQSGQADPGQRQDHSGRLVSFSRFFCFIDGTLQQGCDPVPQRFGVRISRGGVLQAAQPGIVIPVKPLDEIGCLIAFRQGAQDIFAFPVLVEQQFPEIAEFEFARSAQQRRLDGIAQGQLVHVSLVTGFREPFKQFKEAFGNVICPAFRDQLVAVHAEQLLQSVPEPGCTGCQSGHPGTHGPEVNRLFLSPGLQVIQQGFQPLPQRRALRIGVISTVNTIQSRVVICQEPAADLLIFRLLFRLGSGQEALQDFFTLVFRVIQQQIEFIQLDAFFFAGPAQHCYGLFQNFAAWSGQFRFVFEAAEQLHQSVFYVCLPAGQECLAVPE